LIRQSVLDGLLLSIAGAAAGLVLARWGIDALSVGLPPASLPRQQEVTVDSVVFGFALLLALLTGLLSGLAPAWT